MTSLQRLSGLRSQLAEAGAVWQRLLTVTQAVPDLALPSAGHQTLSGTVQQQQQQQRQCLAAPTYCSAVQVHWQQSLVPSLQHCSSSTSVFRRSFSSCSSSYHSADSSSGNSSNGEGTSSSSSDESTTSSSSRGKDMAIMFTCGKCDTRSVKAFSKHSYDKGLVLVRCPGCKALHLIADHLGWFGDTSFKIEEYMAAQGQTVKRVSLDAAQQQGQAAGQAAAPQLTAEDLAGWSKVQQLLSTVAAAAAAGSNTKGEGTQHRGCSSSSSPAASDEAAGSTAACSGVASAQTAAAAAAAAAVADSGVVQVAPEDVEAWARVQQQQQLQE